MAFFFVCVVWFNPNQVQLIYIREPSYNQSFSRRQRHHWNGLFLDLRITRNDRVMKLSYKKIDCYFVYTKIYIFILFWTFQNIYNPKKKEYSTQVTEGSIKEVAIIRIDWACRNFEQLFATLKCSQRLCNGGHFLLCTYMGFHMKKPQSLQDKLFD